MLEKSIQQLKHIAKYCEKISLATQSIDKNGILFLMKSHYQTRDICSFYLLQIGELVSALPDELKQNNTQIPWKAIKGFRNIVAHRYGTVDSKILWDIINNHVPILNKEVRSLLRNEVPDIDKTIRNELIEELGIENEQDNTPTR